MLRRGFRGVLRHGVRHGVSAVRPQQGSLASPIVARHLGCQQPAVFRPFSCLTSSSSSSSSDRNSRNSSNTIRGISQQQQQQQQQRWMSSTSSSSSPEEEHSFQAETRQLLDIVTNSLYTDKEVFLRELVSNASDALEKLRHLQATGAALNEPDVPLQITIRVDKEAKTLTISDTGVGLSKEDMMENLGTIARSGSKAFVSELGKDGSSDADAASSIIGQFGVGFYSAFMVGSRVSVASKPAAAGESAHVWTSEGSGSYSISAWTDEDDAAAAPKEKEEDAKKDGEEKEDGKEGGEEEDDDDEPEFKDDGTFRRGSRITIQLKDDQSEFLELPRLRGIITKYSNFVNFPILLEGEVVNTVQAIWTKAPQEVDDDEYKSFYQFLTAAFDEPKYRMHFRADAPLDLKVLLYVPSFHMEKWGGGRMDPGVSLYSRKVLIEKDSPGLLPEWMRFVKGVVDSEDLPLSISREKPQDSRLLRRISGVLVKRVLRFLNDKATKDAEGYKKWFSEFGFFLKEGVCQDYDNQADIAKLLFFESSSLEGGELCSLDEYVSRCTPEQDQIYYLMAPNRKMAEESPYYEAFKAHGREVIFVYNAIDEFVMTNIGTYNKRKILSAESSEVDLGIDDDEKKDEDADDDDDDEAKKKKDEEKASSLSDEQVKELEGWMLDALPGKLKGVKPTKRLAGHPAIITDHESGALRRMMRMVEQQNTGTNTLSDVLPPQTMEVNPKHPIIVGLHARGAGALGDDATKLIMEQLYDNALVTAGLMDDSRGMVARVNTLLEKLIASEEQLKK